MKFKVILCVALCVVPAFVFAATQNFTRTLSLGMHGEDVRAMQKVLNADPDTRIASSGAGSPGNESDYFGLATKRALIKFQEKYRGEILTPAGLVSGTGVFGAKTRAKATTLMVTRAVSTPIVPPVSIVPVVSVPVTPTAVVEKGDVFLMFPSQYSGKAGTIIKISGSGFTKTDNTIYFGEWHAVEKASSWNGQEISFKVPAIPKGIYSLFIKNARGESNKDQFFVVTDGVTPEPKIESLSPARVTRGSTVTIKGSGFTTKGNMIRTGTSVETNIISTDGTSLSYSVPLNTLMSTTSISGASKLSSATTSVKKISFPLWIYVVNENGVSNGKSVDLEL